MRRTPLHAHRPRGQGKQPLAHCVQRHRVAQGHLCKAPTSLHALRTHRPPLLSQHLRSARLRGRQMGLAERGLASKAPWKHKRRCLDTPMRLVVLPGPSV